MSAPPPPPTPAKTHNKDDKKNRVKIIQAKKDANRIKQIVKEKTVVPKKAPTELSLACPSAIIDLPSTEVQSLKLEKSNLMPVNSEAFAWREPTVKEPQQNPKSKLELSPSVIKDLPSDNSVMSLHLEQNDLKPMEKNDAAFAYVRSKPKPKSTNPQTSPRASKAPQLKPDLKTNVHHSTPASSSKPVLRTSPAHVKNSPNSAHSSKSKLPPKVSPKNAAPKSKNQATIPRQQVINFGRITQIAPTKNEEEKKERAKFTKGSKSPHSPMILTNKKPNNHDKEKNSTPKPKVTSVGTKYTVKTKPTSVKGAPTETTPTGQITNTVNANAHTEERPTTNKKNIVVTSKVFKPPPKE